MLKYRLELALAEMLLQIAVMKTVLLITEALLSISVPLLQVE